MAVETSYEDIARIEDTYANIIGGLIRQRQNGFSNDASVAKRIIHRYSDDTYEEWSADDGDRVQTGKVTARIATGAQLVASYSASVNTEMQTDVSGNFEVTPTGDEIKLTASLVTANGLLTLEKSTLSATSDDQSFTPTTSYVKVTSDNATATNRTLDIQTPSAIENGAMLTLVNSGSNAFEIISSQATGATIRIPSPGNAIALDNYDQVTMIYDGGEWIVLNTGGAIS